MKPNVRRPILSKRLSRNRLFASSAVALAFMVQGIAPAAAQDDSDPLAPKGEWSANIDGRADVPPMGWNTWNAFYHDIDEEKVMASAQIIVDSGLADAGYKYVNLDDGWFIRRSQPDGRMVVRTERFPSAEGAGPNGLTSLRPLVDRLHGMGLKAGIYSDIGRNTCGQAYSGDEENQPKGTVLEREVGLFDHIDEDIQLYFDEWGFDYIKVDGCGIRAMGAGSPKVQSGQYREFEPLIDMQSLGRTDIEEVQNLFVEVADALKRHNPDGDFVFSVCLWGSSNVREWAKNVGNVSRTSDDISASWTRMLTNFDTAATRALYASPGTWNDPDMLFVGAGDFDADHMREARTHFGLWAIVNSPLLIGYDLRKATPEQLALFGNKAVVALNQDPAGHQAVPVFHSDDVQIFVKTLANGDKGVAIFNRGLAEKPAVLTAQHLKFADKGEIKLTDLWTGEKSTFEGQTEFTVQPRETLMFRVSGKRALKDGMYLSEIPGDINPAEDGVVAPTADPTIHRSIIPWVGTRGAGDIAEYAGWGGAQADRTPFSNPLRVAGRTFSSGIGVLANSRLEVRNNRFKRFAAEVGIDDTASSLDQPVTFAVYGDGKLLAESEPVAFNQDAVAIEADVRGVDIIELVARTDGVAGMALPVTWGEARLLK